MTKAQLLEKEKQEAADKALLLRESRHFRPKSPETILKEALKNRTHGRVVKGLVEAFQGEKNLVELTRQMVSEDFDWVKLREACDKMTQVGVLRETIAESNFQALLRLGVENLIQNGWQIPDDVVMDSVMMQATTKGLYGVYGSTFRAELPEEVPHGGEFNESQLVETENIVRNRKFGRLLRFERELFEDDQTGEIGTKSTEMGQNMRVVEEIWSFGFLTGSAFTFGSTVVPAPTYTDPDGLPGVYNTTRGNRPASFVAMTQASFSAARTALKKILDPLGNRVMVNPRTVVCATNVEYAANTIMNASWTPTNVAIGAGTPSFPTDFNPIKGMAVVKVCGWAPDNFWALGQEKSRSLIYQLRTPLEVTQEDPTSGDSFKYDSYAFRVRKRWTLFWFQGGCRFWYLGNNGTVTQPNP